MPKVYIVIHSKNKDNVYEDRIPSSVCLDQSVAFEKAISHIGKQLNTIKTNGLENGHKEGFERMRKIFLSKDHYHSAVLAIWNIFVSMINDINLDFVHVYEKELE